MTGWAGSSVSIANRYGWTVRGSNPGGARFSAPVQTGPEAHPASCKMGTGSFPGVKYGWRVLLTTRPLLVPRSWNSRAIPLPTLWATTGPVTGTLLPIIPATYEKKNPLFYSHPLSFLFVFFPLYHTFLHSLVYLSLSFLLSVFLLCFTPSLNTHPFIYFLLLFILTFCLFLLCVTL